MVYAKQDDHTYSSSPIIYGSSGGYDDTQRMYNNKPNVNNIPIEKFEIIEDTPIVMQKDTSRVGTYSLLLVIIILFVALEMWSKAGVSFIQTKYYKGATMNYIEYGIWAILITLIFIVVAKLVHVPLLNL